MSEEKAAIRAAAIERAERKAASRMIESKTKRIVHLVFDPKVVKKQSAFTKYFDLFMSGELETVLAEEKEKFAAYIDRMVDETLEEREQPPIEFKNSSFLEVELNGIDNLSFAVANNPFFKVEQEKYFPEAVVIDSNGKIVAHLGGDQNKADPRFPSFKALSNFRDDRIKINDDKKIALRLSEFQEAGLQIIFFVRTSSLTDTDETNLAQYAEAWYRL